MDYTTVANALFVASVRCHFFVFRNFVEKLCVLWALSLVECVAVWALKLPVPQTNALRIHSSQSFSAKLLESIGMSCEHLPQTHHSTLSFLYLITTFRNSVPLSTVIVLNMFLNPFSVYFLSSLSSSLTTSAAV